MVQLDMALNHFNVRRYRLHTCDCRFGILRTEVHRRQTDVPAQIEDCPNGWKAQIVDSTYEDLLYHIRIAAVQPDGYTERPRLIPNYDLLNRRSPERGARKPATVVTPEEPTRIARAQ